MPGQTQDRNLIEPIEHGGESEPARANVTVLARAFGVREFQKRLLTDQMIVKQLRLALKEEIALRVTHECRTSYLFGDAIGEGEVEGTG